MVGTDGVVSVVCGMGVVRSTLDAGVESPDDVSDERSDSSEGAREVKFDDNCERMLLMRTEGCTRSSSYRPGSESDEWIEVSSELGRVGGGDGDGGLRRGERRSGSWEVLRNRDDLGNDVIVPRGGLQI